MEIGESAIKVVDGDRRIESSLSVTSKITMLHTKDQLFERALALVAVAGTAGRQAVETGRAATTIE